MKSWFVTLALVQLAMLSIVGLIRFYLLAQMSETGVAGSDYGLFLFFSSIPSIFVPFVVGHHIDNGRYREIVLWGTATLAGLASWQLFFPLQNLTVMACSFTLIASCVVVAGQLCLKAAVVESCKPNQLMRGNSLNQIVLALSLAIPAGVHLMFYGDYGFAQLFLAMLLILTFTGSSASLKLPPVLNVKGLSRHIRPIQVVNILRQHLGQLGNVGYVLLLLVMNFAIGALEGYAIPIIQAQYGGKGIVYALLAVGCLYFIGSFVSLAINKMPLFSRPTAIYIILGGSLVSMMLAPSLALMMAVCALFFMLHPHIFILTDSRIQRTVSPDAIGTHFSVLRVASFIMLSMGNLVVVMVYHLA